MCLEMEAYRTYHGKHTEMAFWYCQSELDEDGGLGTCPQKKLLEPRPLEHR